MQTQIPTDFHPSLLESLRKLSHTEQLLIAHFLLENIAAETGLLSDDHGETTNVKKLAAFNKIADQYQFELPSDYQFDREEANAR